MSRSTSVSVADARYLIEGLTIFGIGLELGGNVILTSAIPISSWSGSMARTLILLEHGEWAGLNECARCKGTGDEHVSLGSKAYGPTRAWCVGCAGNGFHPIPPSEDLFGNYIGRDR